jgi:hypothetical protein
LRRHEISRLVVCNYKNTTLRGTLTLHPIGGGRILDFGFWILGWWLVVGS